MLSEKPWRIEFVVLFCATQFLCLFFGAVAILLLHQLGAHGFIHDESFGRIVLGTLCFQGATWLLIPFFLWLHHVGWFAAFGFRDPKIKRAFLMAIAFTIVVLPVVLLLQAASIHILEKLGLPPDDQAAVKLLAGAKSLWTVVYLGVFAVVIAPVAEEFIFRGMLYPLVKQLGSPRYALFGISALFAEIHLNAPTLVPLFVFALALTWLYEKTDNLLAPITAHALFNATNLAMLLWQIQHPDK